MRTAALVAAATALSGCRSPRLAVRCEPARMTLHADGEMLPPGARLLAPPYYGTLRFDADAAPEGDTGFTPATRFVDWPPPAPRWLFPFDLPLEALRRLVGLEDRELRIELARRPAPPPGGRGGAAAVQAAKAAFAER